MATSISSAFAQFRTDVVDLDPAEASTARLSRDNLKAQLTAISQQDTTFPRLTDSYLHFGSFARHTKIRPLNDIDLMMFMQQQRTREMPLFGLTGQSSPHSWGLQVVNPTAPLSDFQDDYGYVSSIRVLNKIRDALSGVHDYRKATINRRQQAVALDLISYPWVFDIVPAVEIYLVASDTPSHYLIPDGKGQWMRTDPRMDLAVISRANQAHNSQFIPIVRLLKYWNYYKLNDKPRLPSFYFEMLVHQVFNRQPPITSPRVALLFFFRQCPVVLSHAFPSPTSLGPDLDSDVSADEKLAVIRAMQSAAVYADQALSAEQAGDHRQAIGAWRQVFGTGFPAYG